MTTPIAKLYGCPRSGTEWTANILHENTTLTEIMQNKRGYKHGITLREGLEDTLRILHVVKHPHAWLMSMLRWCHTDPDEVHRRWINRLVNEWATNNTAWLRMFDEHPLYAVVRYEDMLHDPRAEINRVAATLDLHVEKGTIPERKRAPDRHRYDNETPNADEANRDYYLKRLYYKDPSSKKIFQDFSHQLQHHDNEHLRSLGYDYWNNWLDGTSTKFPEPLHQV